MNWKHHSSVTLLFLACAVFLLPTSSIAKTEVVYASYKYVMGDNDTKNDAKRLCFIEAKRRCLEKVGSYVESLTEVQDYKLTKDEIRSYTSAIVKVEVVSENISFEGESVVINTRVKAEVDADHTKRELQRIAKDKGLQARIKKQQNQIESLENKITRLQSELATASYEGSLKLRKQRSTSFESMDDADEKLKSILLAVRKREEEREKLIKEIRKQEAERARTVRKVLQHLKIGMTESEVVQIIEAITGERNVSSQNWDKLSFVFMTDEITGQGSLTYIRYVSYGCVTQLKHRSIDVLKNWGAKKKAISACPDLKKYLWAEE